LKKRIVRTLIAEVVADVDSEACEIRLVIHWKGGVHTELSVPWRRRGFNNGHTEKGLIEAVSILAKICSGDLIAGILNRQRPQNRTRKSMDERARDCIAQPSSDCPR
jgi:hypothetical protein